MVEEGPKDKIIVEAKPTVSEWGISDIPSDSKSPWTLDIINAHSDKGLQFNDPAGETGIWLAPMTFRRPEGGGHFALIAEELSILSIAFREHQGQIPPNYKEERSNDIFKSYLDTTVQIGKKPSESKYIIKGIPDDNASPENNYELMDIEITKDGNAIVTMRDTRRGNQGSMEFRTAKNGGKFPIMAEVFTRIAQRIAKAKYPKLKI